ncbi:hypothetical protein RhiJN_12472 [Ceratobasidium sp. AG-Ba]|nr:hypothetical protein RhiJN_12472 [Ceratobasidium sp. AG-Ba]
MSCSNNLDDMLRITPEEYEAYKKWLESREIQANKTNARLDAERSDNCEASNNQLRGRNTQIRRLASFQHEGEGSVSPSDNDSESPAPSRRYRTKVRARDKDAARARRRIESPPSPEIDNTPHVPRQCLPPPHHEHPVRRATIPTHQAPHLPCPAQLPAARREHPPSPHPSRDPSPGAGPWPYSRDASPERLADGDLDKVGEQIREANLNRPAVGDPNPYDYPYNNTPTSRVLQGVDGKRARGGRTSNTHIEKLGDWRSKHLYARERVHPFAIKHGISWFNPYSAIKAPLEYYELIKKPDKLVKGPGQGGTQLHEEAGFRSDLDFWSIMQRVVREGLARFAPRNLEPGVRPTWSRYLTSAQWEVYRYRPSTSAIKQAKIVANRCDCPTVSPSPSLMVTKKFPPKIARDINPDLDNYNDDYSANACVPLRGSSPSSYPAPIPAPRATSRALATRASPAHAAPRATGRVDQLHERDRRPDHSRGQSNPRPANDPNSTINPRAPLSAPVAPRPNQKQRALPEKTVSSGEESDEEPAARNLTRKIKPVAREHAKAKPPVQETKEGLAPATSKKTGKATQLSKVTAKAPVKALVKVPTKALAKAQAISTNAPGRCKVGQAEDDQATTTNKRSKATGNVDTPKRKAVEDDESNLPKRKKRTQEW